MTYGEAIKHFEVIRDRCRRNLSRCKAKPNRLPVEESNLRKKLEAVTMAINALKYASKKHVDTSRWMQDIWEASWDD